MSGVEIGDAWVRKGAVDAILDFLKKPRHKAGTSRESGAARK